jgi:hypothetical protein
MTSGGIWFEPAMPVAYALGERVYDAEEQEARTARRGLWSGAFQHWQTSVESVGSGASVVPRPAGAAFEWRCRPPSPEGLRRPPRAPIAVALFQRPGRRRSMMRMTARQSRFFDYDLPVGQPAFDRLQQAVRAASAGTALPHRAGWPLSGAGRYRSNCARIFGVSRSFRGTTIVVLLRRPR